MRRMRNACAYKKKLSSMSYKVDREKSKQTSATSTHTHVHANMQNKNLIVLKNNWRNCWAENRRTYQDDGGDAGVEPPERAAENGWKERERERKKGSEGERLAAMSFWHLLHRAHRTWCQKMADEAAPVPSPFLRLPLSRPSAISIIPFSSF